MKLTRIPHGLDALPQLFFWELDEFVIIVTCFALGIMLGGTYILFCIAGGHYLSKIFRRYKDNGLPGQLNHLAHYHNIFNLNGIFTRGGNRTYTK